MRDVGRVKWVVTLSRKKVRSKRVYHSATPADRATTLPRVTAVNREKNGDPPIGRRNEALSLQRVDVDLERSESGRCSSERAAITATISPGRLQDRLVRRRPGGWRWTL